MTQQKTIDTLVQDIYSLFDPKVMHEPNEDNLEEFAQNLKQILRVRLASREDVRDPLRFSALGKPDRQLWYMAHGYPSEEMTPKTYFKFLYGDVIEALLLFLAKESGHSVEAEQMEIEVDGVKGHIDAIIDGSIENAEKVTLPVLNLTVPKALNNVSEGILDPRDTYADVNEWTEKAKSLAAKYIKNFEQYCDNDDAKALIASGPQL